MRFGEYERSKGEGGYTLLELVIALSVLSMLALALSGGLQFGSRAWERTTDDAEHLEAHTIVLDSVRSWLHDAHTFSDITGDRRVTYPVEGGERALSFTAPLFRGGINNALYRINLRFDDSRGALVAAWSPARIGQLDPGDDLEASSRVLIENVRWAEFEYFDFGTNGEKGRWVSAWRERKDMPGAFELKLLMTDGETEEVVIRARVTREAGCRFDPVSRACR